MIMILNLTLLVFLLPFANHVHTFYADAIEGEEAAARQLTLLKHEYQHNINSILKNHTSGCTPDKIVYRQEWHASTKAIKLSMPCH